MEVAQIILQQIKALNYWALGSWGARDYVGGKIYDGNEGIKFKVNGTKTKRGSWIMITLNGKDLYDIRLYRIYKMEVIWEKEENDVFCEDLVEIIDSMVG